MRHLSHNYKSTVVSQWCRWLSVPLVVLLWAAFTGDASAAPASAY